MILFAKYLILNLCAFYSYLKILNITSSKRKTALSVGFVSLLAFLAALCEHYLPYAALLLVILSSFLFLTQSFYSMPGISLTAVMIAYGISYALRLFSALITSMILALFLIKTSFYNLLLSLLLTSLIQLLLTYLLFLPRRLRKGMPFITNRLQSNPLMLTAVIILLAAFLFSQGNTDLLYLIPFLLVFFFAIFIYISWRSKITKTYLDRLKENDIALLNKALEEKENYILELEKDKEALAKIVHSDNKLIPAMTMGVTSFIEEASGLSPEIQETGREILEHLHALSADRQNIIHTQDNACRKLPATGILTLDQLLNYMQQKANLANVTFDASVSCDLNKFIGNPISEPELRTLLADLLDNAIIAAKSATHRYVFLEIAMVSRFYTINIYDSGAPFAKEVLANLGQLRYTTHADEGGSGIGLVSSYEILRKYQASLTIDEYSKDSGLYRKKVSVSFNRMNQYALYSRRSIEELAFLHQRSDLLVFEK